MGNSWKYAQILQFPQSGLCECGHRRKDHNNMKDWCHKCWGYGKVADMTDPPPDDVLGFLVGKREECKKFHHWSVERVRRFWTAVNIEQTILDDYYPISNNYS